MSAGYDDQPSGATPARVKGRISAPWGMVGMCGLLILIETFLSGHDLSFTAPWDWDWRTTGKLTARKQGKGDVLLFGDSLMKFGVMPKVIQQRSGRTAYNFALHTGQTPSSYFMFRRVLDAGNHPRAVILELTPHMFRQNSEANTRLWPEMLTVAESFDLAWTKRSPGFFAATMLGHLVPSIKERHDIRAFIHASCLGQPTGRWRDEIPFYRRNWKKNLGAQLMPDGPSPPIDPVHWELSLYRKWQPDPVNVAYLKRFLKLARSAKVPVIWLLPPNQPSIVARTEASGYEAEYTHFVERVAARYPEVTVLDARRSGFVPDEFNDGIHLKRPGALRLSTAIGDLLRDHLPDGGWVKLDAGAPRTIDLPMEDVNQSAVAFRNESGRATR